MAVRIDTEIVLNVAENIAKENNSLRNAYEDIEHTVTKLRNNWVGDACDRCCNRADQIKSMYKERRYEEVNEFIAFLKNKVGERYECTERMITSKTNAFK